MLKIIWVTRSRKHRVISHWWEGFRKEVSKFAHVTSVVLPAEKETIYTKQEKEEYEKSIELLMKPENTNNNFDILYNESPAAYSSVPWRKITIPKAMFMNDQHGVHIKKYFKRAFYENAYNILFMTYRDSLLRFHPDLQNNFICIWLPFAIDPNIFKDYKENKNIDCLSVGIIDPKIYPLRSKAHQELKSYKGYVRIERPPEKFIGNKWPVGEIYAKIINKSRLVITDSSIYKYPVLKYFEIPACQSVLCADYLPELRDLGFIHNENMIALKKNMNIRKTILNLLKDKEKLDSIAQKANELVHTKHTLKIRAQEFVKNIKRILI